MGRATSNSRHGSNTGSNTRPGSSGNGADSGSADRQTPQDSQQTPSLSGFTPDRSLTIGEVAQQYGITLRTLRFYEAKRLLTPHRHGATRLYGSSDRKRLNIILTGRRLGFTLAEIKLLLSKASDGALQLTREQCVNQIKLLEQQKRSIETAITELREIHTSFYRRLLEEASEPTH